MNRYVLWSGGGVILDHFILLFYLKTKTSLNIAKELFERCRLLQKYCWQEAKMQIQKVFSETTKWTKPNCYYWMILKK